MKSYLGEGLHCLSNKKKEKINVCSCGCPLIFTFAFPYKEYVCLECGNTFGMLGVEGVEETKELKFKKNIYEKIWKILYSSAWFLPTGNYTMKNCKKCKTEQHNNHLSKNEIIKDKIAKDIFNRLTASNSSRLV